MAHHIPKQDHPSPPALAPGAMMRWHAVSSGLPERLGEVLEIGCGRGGFAARIAPRCRRYLALEPDNTSREIATGTAGHCAEISGQFVEELPDTARFDMVCAFEVLEHLEDDAAALYQWSERLRPGGRLIISTPAHSKRLGEWDRMVGHHRRYDVEQMRELLIAAGLTDVRVMLYGYPVGNVLEAVRNRIAARRMRRAESASDDYATRTASSARLLQPSGLMASAAMRLIALPLAMMQKLFPGRGIALIASATMPEQ
ncbi:class I SAM-dependent methyltransferase [Erythrobacter alti]|uniref:class I SAM-dependent methyltransferase n=1 Tax=Erythrobacter alti TaxID=1896145 RepID=UPI0030F4081E